MPSRGTVDAAMRIEAGMPRSALARSPATWRSKMKSSMPAESAMKKTMGTEAPTLPNDDW